MDPEFAINLPLFCTRRRVEQPGDAMETPKTDSSRAVPKTAEERLVAAAKEEWDELLNVPGGVLVGGVIVESGPLSCLGRNAEPQRIEAVSG